MTTKQSRTGLYEELNTMRIAFWHPFGPHGGESAEEILERKQKECADVGETFWTFRAAGKDTVEFWRDQIRKHGGLIDALCVFRDSHQDAKGGRRFVRATFWQDNRDGPHKPIHRLINATISQSYPMAAFRVAAVDILVPGAYPRRRGKLLRPGSSGSTGPLGRGQKLVRFGGGNESRLWKGEVVAILRLKEPWIVWVGKS